MYFAGRVWALCQTYLTFSMVNQLKGCILIILSKLLSPNQVIKVDNIEFWILPLGDIILFQLYIYNKNQPRAKHARFWYYSYKLKSYAIVTAIGVKHKFSFWHDKW